MDDGPSVPPAERARGRLHRTVPRWAQIAAVQAIAVVVVGALIHVPFHSVAPGPTTNILEKVSVRGARTFESDGGLLLTTASVSTGSLTVWDALYVWLDPGVSTLPRAFLIPPGSSDEEQDILNRHDIEQSKIDAAVAAFRALGEEVPILDGAQVVTVIEGMPADGKVRAQDRIIAIDGRAVRTQGQVVRAIGDRRPGDPITITLERRGERREVRVETAAVDGQPFVGVTLGPAYGFPNDVVIDSEDVVGPSGGLVFALTIADVFTRRDLTRGHTIGVTGIIRLDKNGRGIVDPIGAVGEKVRGAVRDGATVFVVPRVEEAQARAAAPASMTVIGVDTLEGAIDALRRLPRA